MKKAKKGKKEDEERKIDVEEIKHYANVIDNIFPPDNINVSKWCEKNRVLDVRSSAIAGLWRNSITPYLTEIMDTLNDYRISETIFCKPTQVGGTEAMLNMMGYIIAQDPSPTLVVYPSDDIAKSVSKNRIKPMIDNSPAIRDHYYLQSSETLEMQFDNMYMALTGANSPADLSNKPIRYLLIDEVDKFPAASKKEADPVSLAKERTKTYRNSKTYICSTPTLRTGHIWKAKESADVEKHYFIPCPHCGCLIELKFSQIKFPKEEEIKGLRNIDRADLAAYECQECHHHITDSEKNKAMLSGVWKVVRQSKKNVSKVAYWMNTLYSPFVRFSDVVAKFLESKDDPDLLRNFTNSWLAEPWEETKLKTSSEMVLERQTKNEMWELPDWAKLITGGVDVQENCLYYTIRAWGDYLTSQCIAQGQVSSFSDIDRIMNVEFKKKDGTAMLVELCLVDSGDQTDEVYEFCLQHNEWAKPVKGVANQLSHYRISQVNRPNSKLDGMQLILCDGAKYKDMIASRMRKPNGIGSWMVYKDIDMQYCEQVTAEHKVTEHRGGREYTTWKPKTDKADNHLGDAEIYAACAADVCDVRNLYLQNVMKKSENIEIKELDDQIKDETDWINNEMGDWLR